MRQLNASLRAAFYARVSSDHQAEEGTIDSQVEAVRRRAHRRSAENASSCATAPVMNPPGRRRQGPPPRVRVEG